MRMLNAQLLTSYKPSCHPKQTVPYWGLLGAFVVRYNGCDNLSELTKVTVIPLCQICKRDENP